VLEIGNDRHDLIRLRRNVDAGARLIRHKP
jgi:hypothetical protein